MELILSGVCAAAAVFAWWLSGVFRSFAIRRGILDVPNARSSHTVPTPRGGGVAIVLATLAGIAVLAAVGLLEARVAIAMGAGGTLIAAVGYADDRRPLAPWSRLWWHFAGAAWLVAWLGLSEHAGFPLTDRFIHLGALGDLLVVLYVTWAVNLTNFMDGIDGLAGVEVMTVSGGTAALVFAAGTEPALAAMPLLLASAALGFVLWNWPPARIFMGDAGSGFVGFMLAAVALRAGQAELSVFWGSAILFGVFLVDATITLARRLLRGEPIHVAHRTHAYQRAAQRFGSHRTVTLTVIGINLLWLFPIALLVATRRVGSAIGIAVAFTPLVVAAVRLGAGKAANAVDDRAGDVTA